MKIDPYFAFPPVYLFCEPPHHMNHKVQSGCTHASLSWPWMVDTEINLWWIQERFSSIDFAGVQITMATAITCYVRFVEFSLDISLHSVHIKKNYFHFMMSMGFPKARWLVSCYTLLTWLAIYLLIEYSSGGGELLYQLLTALLVQPESMQFYYSLVHVRRTPGNGLQKVQLSSRKE